MKMKCRNSHLGLQDVRMCFLSLLFFDSVILGKLL